MGGLDARIPDVVVGPVGDVLDGAQRAEWSELLRLSAYEARLIRALERPFDHRMRNPNLGWARTYDAEYVALARLLDANLVTLDARLQRGAGRLVTIVGPPT